MKYSRMGHKRKLSNGSNSLSLNETNDTWECILSPNKNGSAIKLKKVKKKQDGMNNSQLINKKDNEIYENGINLIKKNKVKKKKLLNSNNKLKGKLSTYGQNRGKVIENGHTNEMYHKTKRKNIMIDNKLKINKKSKKSKKITNKTNELNNHINKKIIKINDQPEFVNGYHEPINKQIYNNKDYAQNSLDNIIAHVNSLKGAKLKKKKIKKLKLKLANKDVTNYYNHCNFKLNEDNNENSNDFRTINNCVNINFGSELKINKTVTPLVKKKTKKNKVKLKKKSIGIDKFNIAKESLPIFEVKNNLIKFVLNNDTSILVGETGCGKSTQVPQFLYEHKVFKDGIICITQPRKIAATSLAKRVTEEVGTKLGDIVGYSVRFDEKTSNKTKIKYVTDGMLLREFLSDPLLMKYQWIILDEAHERTVGTDILFGIVKKAQKVRKLNGKKELKIIIMSATMDVDRFVSYFDNSNAKVIVGRQHGIDYTFVSKSNKDYYIMCLSLLLKLHRKFPINEGFLVFLTGQDEIENFVRQINNITEDKMFSDYPGIEAYPLFAQLPDHEQVKIFKSPAFGKRKVIISTNIAETSITIPGISVVIDSCHVKTRSQNPNTGFEELKIQKISIAQAFQRAGRAGREGPGYYFSVLTKEEFESLKENPVPDILKSELSSTCLTLFGAGIKNVIKFDFFDRPPVKHLRLAETELRDLKVISGYGNDTSLTELGHKVKYLPLKPHFGKVVLKSAELRCSEEVLTIISLLSCESIYINPSGKYDEARFKRKKFQAIEGDHITLLNVFNAFKGTTNPKAWCHKNFLNFRNLDYACNIRKQLLDLCEKKGIPILSCQVNEDPYKVDREPILKSLISGLFKNVAKWQPRRKYKCLNGDQEVFIHPSSLLFGSGAEYVLFTNVTSTGKQYMNINSIIDPQWLKEVCPEYFKAVDFPVLNNIFSAVS